MTDTIRVVWETGPDAPASLSREGQEAQSKVRSALQRGGLKYKYPDYGMAFDSADVPLDTIIEAAVLTSGILGVVKVLTPIIVAYIKARAGNYVRITAGDRTVEARTIQDAESMWKLLAGDEQKHE